MSHITSRIYKDEKDFQIIIDLLTKVRPAEHLNDYPVKVDIEENLASADVRANTRLWFDDGQPIGWAYVDDFNNLRWELDSQYDELIGSEIVAWGETCIRKTPANGETTTLDASCREDYAERISFLKRHGFIQTDVTTVAMVRHLSEPIPEPELATGIHYSSDCRDSGSRSGSIHPSCRIRHRLHDDRKPPCYYELKRI